MTHYVELRKYLVLEQIGSILLQFFVHAIKKVSYGDFLFRTPQFIFQITQLFYIRIETLQYFQHNFQIISFQVKSKCLKIPI